MYTEDDLLPISALQHLAFCERQWGLIHIESVWLENRLTAEGRQLHDKAHEAETESRGGLRVARGLRLRSLRLGLVGMADVVEFHRVTAEEGNGSVPGRCPGAVPLEGASGYWKPLLVEYKRGKPKIDRCDEVQVCAQALCLEEMLGVAMASGAIFYGKPRRRYDVVFDAALRNETESLVTRLHDLSCAGKTPLGVYAEKCKSCSLFDVCLPKVTEIRGGVRKYLAGALFEAKENEN